MMSNVKRLRRSSSLVVAVTFLAISFAMGPVRAHADELAVDPCPLPTEIMDVTVAEELDVSCHARAAVAQFNAAMIEASPTVSDVVPLADGPPPIEGAVLFATEGQAIVVEVVQSVTIAIPGQNNDAAPDVTGSLSDGVAPGLN